MNVMTNTKHVPALDVSHRSTRAAATRSAIDRERGDRLHRAMMGVEREILLLLPGLSRATLHRALHGHNLRRATWVRLSCALNVNVAWLADGIGEMQPVGESRHAAPRRDEPWPRQNECPALTATQRDALRSCIVLAHSVFAARKHAALPLTIAETVLGYADFIAAAKGDLSSRLTELAGFVEARMAESGDTGVVTQVRVAALG